MQEELREKVLFRDSYRCQLCGINNTLDVHHIKPKGAGGGDSFKNLIVLCRSCHTNYGHNKTHRAKFKKIVRQNIKFMNESQFFGNEEG